MTKPVEPEPMTLVMLFLQLKHMAAAHPTRCIAVDFDIRQDGIHLTFRKATDDV